MPEYSLMNRNLHALALRGYDAIKPGCKLIIAHVSNWSSYYQEYTAVTGLVEMTGGELDRIRGFKMHDSNSEKRYTVFLVRNQSGKLDYYHAADAGVLPYNLGTENAMWNKSNFTVNKRDLKRLKIKISK